MSKLNVGQYVIFEKLPDWVSILPAETRRIFEFCQGKPYPIAEIQKDMLVLDVSSDVDAKFGGRFNDLRIEAKFVRAVGPPRKPR